MTEALRRLVLLRHGQTAWNLSGRAQGHRDIDLDETGRTQAARVAPIIATRYRPVRLVSSDLQRARSTAAMVGQACGLTPSHDAAFREFAIGPNREGTTVPEWRERFPEEYALFKAGRWHEIPGRETEDDVIARFVPELSAVAASLDPGECAVVVTHGSALRRSIVDFLGWPVAVHAGLAGLGNCHWIEVEEYGSARWRMVAYNLSAAVEADEDENNAG